MKILIPLDGSRLSERAMDRLKPLAEAARAEVHLLRVYPPPAGALFVREAVDAWRGKATASHEFGYGPPAMPEPLETYDQAVARLALEGEAYLREKAKAFPDLVVAVRVLINRQVTEAIVGYAREVGFDLIGMASRDRSGLARLLLSSAPRRVAAAGVAPVFVAAPRRTGPALQALIFDEAGTAVMEQCLGPDAEGRCPRVRPEGTAACAGRRIMTLTPAGFVGGAVDIGPRERLCPLAAFTGVTGF